MNERFGDGRKGTVVQINPFLVAITARYTIGPDRQREALLAAQAMARAGRGGRGGSPADSANPMAGVARRYAPNVFRQILNQADTLHLDLSEAQKSLLTLMSDSLVKQIDTLGMRLLRKSRSLGNNVDPAAAQIQLRPILVEAQELGASSIKDARTILTPAQWEKLPERMTRPQTVFGPIGGRGGRPPGLG